MRRTKIVCTLGPAVSSEAMLRELIRAGMDVARLNFSPRSYETHAQAIKLIRRLAYEEGRHVAILQDLQGPRIRTGEVADPNGQIMLVPDQEINLTTRQVPGDAEYISIQSVDLPSDVKPGDRILLDEGLLELQVHATTESDVRCRIITGGPLRARKGLNVPGVTLSVPTVTEKDIADHEFGITHEVDFIALSIVGSTDNEVDMNARIAR